MARAPGRKPTPANQGQRVSLGLKVVPEIKNQLDAAAKFNGRTQSQEAEVRLENSFRNERVLDEAIDLHFGRANGDLLLSLFGAVLNTATEVSRTQSRTDHWTDDLATRKAVASLLRSMAVGLDRSAEPPKRSPTISELLMRDILVRVMTPEWLAQRRERLGSRADWLEEWVRDLQRQHNTGPKVVISTTPLPFGG